MHGELTTLGIKIAPSTVWEILKQEGLDPAPERTSPTGADFLHSPTEALLACDCIEAAPSVDSASTSWPPPSAPAGPFASWPPLLRARAGGGIQAMKNLVTDLQDTGCQAARYLVRYRDRKFPALIEDEPRGD